MPSVARRGKAAIQLWREGIASATIRRLPDPTEPKAMATVCKHPRVRIVSRHDDAEFVECLECGEIFDSEEFHDMAIEDTVETEEAESDY